ncbi:DUF3073 domain-containing protein [Propioniciclava coleopterorum]|uniref:DUF3073 domain-containing protein n=1 Tax=Propioniciclava coleopterorum TaxID=2714937 RepID=A0A6G7Y816_9ACTN|nr:DUF3073 domain-containing protein [Propioniciclava coleopterorum]QIK72757.1 DUF3073 domain-containing protein [Propioniciclava coleopterorum]
MGRGRAKAKQTKVARDLKYRTFDTDFSSLERELRGGQSPYGASAAEDDVDDTEDEYDDDPYADDDDEADDDDAAGRGGY